MDPKDTYFRIYDEAKTIISLEIQIPQILKRGKKGIENFENKFGKIDAPLVLTKGKDDDIEEGKEKECPKKKKKDTIKKIYKVFYSCDYCHLEGRSLM